jgi:rhamnogalacturonan endolyase
MNFWRNQGIMHILDSNGQLLGDYEPRCEHGSAIPPVNWTGKAAEFLLVNPDPEFGGLYDGEGRCVVRLPADGHPTRSYDAIDLVGDARDEMIVWDSQEIWIYTQDDGETKVDPDSIVQRKRNGRHNESNYRARVSVPR